MTYSFYNAQVFDNLGLPADDSRRKALQIINPISDDFRTIRTTLTPCLLSTVAYNQARQSERTAIFEVGRVFIPKTLPLTDFPEEKMVLAIAMSGKRNPFLGIRLKTPSTSMTSKAPLKKSWTASK